MGERIEFKGDVYESHPRVDCKGCAFTFGSEDCLAFPGACSGAFHDDGKSVVWVKVEGGKEDGNAS